MEMGRRHFWANREQTRFWMRGGIDGDRTLNGADPRRPIGTAGVLHVVRKKISLNPR